MNNKLVRNIEIGNVELGDGLEHGDTVVEAFDGSGTVDHDGIRVAAGEVFKIEVPFMVIKFVDDAFEWTLIG